MIYGIGTDIVRIERMRNSLSRFGEKFARRILTAHELEGFQQASKPEHFLAKRFAAKEAAAKALGTGFSDGLSLTSIGIQHDDRGKPVLEFLDRASELCRQKGIGECHVSIADEDDHAVAFVVLLST
jgi:holo-[acyl-carrier protein] synthase